jgi:hypothetical protein
MGTQRGPSAVLLFAGISSVAYVGIVAAMGALILGRSVTSKTLARVTQLGTLAVLSVAYFFPAIKVLAEASAWAPAWPLQQRVLGTPLLTLDLSKSQRLLISGVWLLGLFTIALRAVGSRPLLANSGWEEVE